MRALEACKSSMSLISGLIQFQFIKFCCIWTDALFKEFSSIDQELQLHCSALMKGFNRLKTSYMFMITQNKWLHLARKYKFTQIKVRLTAQRIDFTREAQPESEMFIASYWFFNCLSSPELQHEVPL